MKKRFILRKIHQYAYSRQGWRMADKGFVYAIYDREWRKNLEKGYGFTTSRDIEDSYKYINNAHWKEVAQFWADWLNANKAETFGGRITIPYDVFNNGLELYKSEQTKVS